MDMICVVCGYEGSEEDMDIVEDSVLCPDCADGLQESLANADGRSSPIVDGRDHELSEDGSEDSDEDEVPW